MRTGGFWALLLAALGVPSLVAAEPAIRDVSVRGLQVGGTTTVVIDGEDLTANPRLLLPFPAQSALKPGSTERRATFDVALGGDVMPGFVNLRLATDGGVSLPVVVGLDRLPQKPLSAPVESLPVALHGSVSGSNMAEAKFPGKAGQKVLVEVEAQRLGAKLRPVVHLHSPKKLQLAWSWPTPGLGGDTRLEATLPEDGTYTVAVHDVEYNSPAPGHFRLKIGQWAFVDQVFPPVVGKGQKDVELIGPTQVTRLDLPATLPPALVPLTWPREGTWSGPRPFVRVSDRPEVVEQATSDRGQEVPAGPLGVSGRLLKPGEEDRYRVPVTPRSRVRFEVFAERLGSPLDVALVLRNDMGAELARAEDGPNTLDAAIDYSVPDKVTSVLVCVADPAGRGGSRGVYRLTVDPQQKQAPRGEFELSTPARRLAVPSGGTSLLPVLLDRKGYQGSVTLSAEGLPTGIKLEGGIIPPGSDGVLLALVRGEGSPQPAIVHLRGKGQDGQERPVLGKADPLERLQPWLASELAVAPTSGKASEFQVDWRNLPADATLAPAGKLALPVKVTRPESNALVRLSLLTAQPPVMVNNQPNPNLALRAEKPVELAAKVKEGEVTLLIPAQLDADVYDLAVQAELLSADRRTVLATAFTPVRRLAVKLPVALQLTTPARLEAKLNGQSGATLDLKGKVERRAGFAGDVTVTLTGLPPGAQAAPVTVKAGATDFSVRLTLPASTPTGEVAGLKLTASCAPNAQQPNVRVRSRDVDLTLAVQPAVK